MAKNKAETASAKGATAEPTPKAEEKVDPAVVASGDGAGAVVVADGVIDQAKNAELAVQEAKAQIEAEEKEKVLAEINAKAEADRAGMVAKLVETKRAEVVASMEDRMSLNKQLEMQAEIEAQATEELEAELKAAKAAETDETWKKDKNAQISKRVFRSAVWKHGSAVRKPLITLNRQDSMVKGTQISALTVPCEPNHADQYVLRGGAVDYTDQLAALRRYEELGKIKEIDPKFEGIPWVPVNEAKIRKLRAEITQLEAKR